MNISIISIASKNIHKQLAPWCLKAYCEANGFEDIKIIEMTVNDNINSIVANIFQAKPDIAAFSCYIWNIELVKKICVLLKKLLPDIIIILGGPEVSFEKDLNNFPFADYIIKGAGEKAFFDLLSRIKFNNNINNTIDKTIDSSINKTNSDSEVSGIAECIGESETLRTEDKKVIEGGKVKFSTLISPYSDEYFNSFKNNQIPSIEHQLIYYESSRGCPFSCSYCLSCVNDSVDFIPTQQVKADIMRFIEKGAKCIKFVDRTFNANKKRAKIILRFIHDLDTDCTFHFEAAADLFDEEMLEIIEKMPLSRVQFELGIQSVNEKTLDAVNRKTDLKLVFKNLEKLISFNNCHIHVDLIAGLPAETMSTFKDAINRCIRLRPQMLQLGFLKMLKGSHLREKNNFGAVFADFPPYEVFQTDTMTYDDIIKLKKIENIIERFYNSGAFSSSIELALTKHFKTPYEFFDEFSSYCCENNINTKVSMKNAYTVLYNFLLLYFKKTEVEHYIKFDSLSFDSKGMLPDCIKPHRIKNEELKYNKLKNGQNLRVEYFESDNTYRLFIYDKKHPITNRFDSNIIKI